MASGEHSTPVANGFTLMEVIVALAIFSIIASASAGVLELAIDTGEETSIVSERMQKLAAARAIMRSDFAQMVLRPARGEFGTQTSIAFEGGFLRDQITLARFSRRGRVNPGGRQPRGGITEVQYLLINNQVIRRTWPMIDPTPDMQPIDQLLFDDVSAARMEFLANNIWQQVFEADIQTQRRLPAAIAFTVTSEDFGTVRQVFIGTGSRGI